MGGLFSKGLASAAVAVYAYMNHTFTPLIWVLGALIAVDLLLNFHNEEKSVSKIVTTAGTLVTPSMITPHFDIPHLTQVTVVVLTIAYIQVVFPQLGGLLGKLKIGTATDKAALAAALAAAEAKVEALTAQQAAKAGVPDAQATQAQSQTPLGQ